RWQGNQRVLGESGCNLTLGAGVTRPESRDRYAAEKEDGTVADDPREISDVEIVGVGNVRNGEASIAEVVGRRDPHHVVADVAVVREMQERHGLPRRDVGVEQSVDLLAKAREA